MGQVPLKISIVIPVYNEEKYIGACLESLLKQSEPADEIIVINNNSTDNSVKIIKTFPVRLLHEKKQGMTFARNRGFNDAKYEIIARTDADTILPLNWVKRIKKAFIDEKVIAVTGPGEFYDLPEFIHNSRWQTKAAWVKVIIGYNKIVKQIIKHDCLYGPNYAIRKYAWKEIKNTVCMDDKQVHEDLDLAIHIAPLGIIKFYRNLVVKTSVRRWKKPEAYVEYLYRGLKSIQKHQQLSTGERSKLLVKKFVSKAFLINR
ncbi:MAG: glycosyltransferase family 2 protein [Candidatus Levybacteria bacterium]|nr:glycosyltransferase family 2 protein [Candidatus Levybacteria bacterium]